MKAPCVFSLSNVYRYGSYVVDFTLLQAGDIGSRHVRRVGQRVKEKTLNKPTLYGDIHVKRVPRVAPLPLSQPTYAIFMFPSAAMLWGVMGGLH